jgi:hypothetical protein
MRIEYRQNASRVRRRAGENGAGMRLARCWNAFRRLRGVVVAFMAVAVLGAAGPAHAQVNYDRPGGDYASVVVRPPIPDPATCATRCERDGRCRAWSFRYPTTDNPSATCWLKKEVPGRVDDPCCASGVRGAGVIEPRTRTTEFSTDRYGGDYRHYDLPPSANGAACRHACEAEAKCRAWTYQRPGYFGQNLSARCYLKNRVTPPRRRAYGISGVVR